MKIKIYKCRAAFTLYVNRFLTKILFVDTPPIFSVSAIIERNGKILCIDHSYAKGIGLPGGVVKENESLEKALEREVFEETGLKIKDSRYFGSFSSNLKGVPAASVVFIVIAEGNEKKSDEGGLVWIKSNETIGKFTYEYHDKAILKYLKK